MKIWIALRLWYYRHIKFRKLFREEERLSKEISNLTCIDYRLSPHGKATAEFYAELFSQLDACKWNPKQLEEFWEKTIKLLQKD